MKIRALTAVLATVGVLALAGCAAGTPATKTNSVSSQTASATPTPTPSKDPALLPEAGASANLYYFTWVIEKTLAADPAADSFAIAQAVAAAGFDPATVQFTFSRTAAGLAADTSEVAVQFAGQCIIGQFGPVAPKVISRVMPILATGGCLLGTEVQGLG